MDVAGWDLRKALGLLRGGNATMLEWLDSPVVYREALGFADAVRALGATYYRRDRSFHHYLALSTKQLGEAVKTEDVRIKKFLYALRTALAAQWSLERDDAPPMRLDALADAQVADAATRAQIADVVAAKAGLLEKATYRVPDQLVAFLRETHEHLAGADVERVQPGPVEEFDALFRAWAEA